MLTNVAITAALSPSPNSIITIAGEKIDSTGKSYSGILTRVLYSTEKGWAILKVGVAPCVGVLPNPQIGALYTLQGEWVQKKTKRGFMEWQFQFKSYAVTIDAQKGLKEYLIRECKHIGPSIAVQLVAKFGNETMQILQSQPEKLQEIKGLSATSIREINDWAKQQSRLANLKERLYGIGLLPSQVDRIINAYGATAEEKLRSDCFRLTEIKGFGFKTAAKIADLLGIPATDRGRIRAAIEYQLDQCCQEWGHTCITVGELLRETAKLLNLQQQPVAPILEEMITNEELLTEQTDWREYAEGQGIILPNT